MSICAPGMQCWENTPLPSCPTCDSCITVFPVSCTSECVPVSSDCVFYKGPNLGNSGIETDDDLTTVIEKLDELISSGGVPLSRTLTINGTSYDLSDDRTWDVGVVTSISSGTGISVGGTSTVPI